ncbi:MAG: hypothetical protein CVU57_28335 [Deltaproteobacteria bacterium HGW-Deltaproteobacteria-15]|nr:MAG: hypothetical protein CVU57_28335 [Deltaproteobacteria bacterium HGW-Deltaproteobacteria-15]
MVARVSQVEYNQENPIRRWWNTRTYIQKRLIRFCLSMIVFILCLPLYHAGLFGTVDGPLNPARMGESLAGMGVTRTHSALFFLSILIIAVAWNWIFNLVSYFAGARLTCNKADEEGLPCGARVERRKVIQKKTGQSVPQYVCEKGHKRPDAHFHPVQKGTASHTIWVIAAVFCGIVLFLS